MEYYENVFSFCSGNGGGGGQEINISRFPLRSMDWRQAWLAWQLLRSSVCVCLFFVNQILVDWMTNKHTSRRSINTVFFPLTIRRATFRSRGDDCRGWCFSLLEDEEEVHLNTHTT